MHKNKLGLLGAATINLGIAHHLHTHNLGT